ncbi:F-box/kelch-repeat protein At3g17530-like [Rhododendron vialii]|uniref:F-box/kelch-repeat protein At3g17530-like n=1 Tax=Rhododendron vialii TaxID=182163 RepID=UPI00265E8A8C|nr:F-box/kelch-repeat protein At3g17530-like [Rhododendron vialii]
MEIPEDVLTEILSTVPVKSLLRFISVSKHWHSLIQNPTFISLHHHRSQTNHCVAATKQCVFKGQVRDGTVFSDHHQTIFQQLDLSCSGLIRNDVDVEVVFLVGCHHGLVCLAHEVTSSIMIFNPATKESRLLPKPLYKSKHRSYLGFTFDPKANDYKVIRFCSSFEVRTFTVCFDEDDPSDDAWFEFNINWWDQKVQIYHLSTDSWRETDAVVPEDFPDGAERHWMEFSTGLALMTVLVLG